MKTLNHIHAHGHHAGHGKHHGQGQSLEQIGHHFLHQLSGLFNGQTSLSPLTMLILGVGIGVILYLALYGRTIGLRSLGGTLSYRTKGSKPQSNVTEVNAGLIAQAAYMVVIVGGLLYLISLWTSRLHGIHF